MEGLEQAVSGEENRDNEPEIVDGDNEAVDCRKCNDYGSCINCPRGRKEIANLRHSK